MLGNHFCTVDTVTFLLNSWSEPYVQFGRKRNGFCGIETIWWTCINSEVETSTVMHRTMESLNRIRERNLYRSIYTLPMSNKINEIKLLSAFKSVTRTLNGEKVHFLPSSQKKFQKIAEKYPAALNHVWSFSYKSGKSNPKKNNVNTKNGKREIYRCFWAILFYLSEAGKILICSTISSRFFTFKFSQKFSRKILQCSHSGKHLPTIHFTSSHTALTWNFL